MACELLQKVLQAHGGLDRWNSYEKVQATIVTGGQLFGMKGTPQDSTPRRMTVATNEGLRDSSASFQVAVEELNVMRSVRVHRLRDVLRTLPWWCRKRVAP